MNYTAYSVGQELKVQEKLAGIERRCHLSKRGFVDKPLATTAALLRGLWRGKRRTLAPES